MVSKGDGVETESAERKDRVRCKGGDNKGVKSVKKKQVSYGKFSRMEWMRQQGLYERGFLNTTNHKEGERNGGMFCKMLDHLINKGAWKPSAKGGPIWMLTRNCWSQLGEGFK